MELVKKSIFAWSGVLEVENDEVCHIYCNLIAAFIINWFSGIKLIFKIPFPAHKRTKVYEYGQENGHS